MIHSQLSQPGFSTLEMLIALGLMVVCISSVILVVFGNQTAAVDAQTESEALEKTQEILETARVTAATNFSTLNSLDYDADDIYSKTLRVTDLDDYTKQTVAQVSWQTDHARNQSVQLATVFTDWPNAVGGSTCASSLSGDWSHAQNNNFNFTQLAGAQSASSTLSSVDAYQGRIYVSADSTATKTNSTFFIFDNQTPGTAPVLKGALDNAVSTIAGINAIQVAGNYAYVASARTIAKTDPSFGQLQIIDVSSSTAPTIKSNFSVPGITSGGVGRSLFYRSGYVYLGLSSVSGSGAEFNIIDVHNFPTTTPSIVGKYSVGSGVEAIYVKGNYAYLAADDHAKEVIMLDVSNPASPTLAGFFDAGGAGGAGNGDGKSLSVIGNTIFAGRTYINNDAEFYIIDASHPSPTSSMPGLGLNDVGPNSQKPFSVKDLLVRGTLGFLLTGSGSKGGSLQIFDVANPKALASSSPLATVSFPNGSVGVGGTSLDCEGNYLYAASVDSSGQSYLSVIKSGH